MRTFSILRALVLATAITAPLAQAAVAQDAQQQALANGNTATASFYGAGPYDNDQLTAPAVGD